MICTFIYYSYCILADSIGHSTVAYSVTWPINGSETVGDFVLIQTSLFCHVNRVVAMLTSLHLHKKSKEVCIFKTRSPAASLPAISQVTQPQVTVKWSIIVITHCKLLRLNLQNIKHCCIKFLHITCIYLIIF